MFAVSRRLRKVRATWLAHTWVRMVFWFCVTENAAKRALNYKDIYLHFKRLLKCWLSWDWSGVLRLSLSIWIARFQCCSWVLMFFTLKHKMTASVPGIKFIILADRERKRSSQEPLLLFYQAVEIFPQTPRWLLLGCHWIELCHVATPSWKGVWKMTVQNVQML